MKKIIWIMALFFLNLSFVQAEESAYLSNLWLTDYELSPTFDKYNNSYSVTIKPEDTSLKLNYTLEDPSATIEILGNDLISEEEQIVTLKITTATQEQNYNIYVTKEKSSLAAAVPSDYQDLSIEKKFNKPLTITLITIPCLIIIYIFKILLFKNKRTKFKNS